MAEKQVEDDKLKLDDFLSSLNEPSTKEEATDVKQSDELADAKNGENDKSKLDDFLSSLDAPEPKLEPTSDYK